MSISLHGKILASRVYPEFFPVQKTDAVLHAGCGEGAQVLAYIQYQRTRNTPPPSFAKGYGMAMQTSPRRGGDKEGKITCCDVQELRVQTTLSAAQRASIKNVEGMVADLESLPFPDASFDKIVAVDIIQHVKHPEKVFAEFRRVLKPSGELLITFPALQHYWITKISRWKRKNIHTNHSSTQARMHSGTSFWSPDAFNHNLSLSEWLRIGASSGLKLIRSHATTLWPPLHRYGIPRFWFSNEIIHRVDWFFGGWPGLKKWGQAIMMIYRK
ncbi:MAG: methyltransferase domain-containing protein [bacterium]|nr:methyltransferase domain-containing protein [bacterium]